MRVLVACEFSATVRDAFRAKGHDAWSCDLYPTWGDPKWHYQCDVLKILDRDWDLMIAHPPCTYLARSGARWWPDRQKEQGMAIEFFMALANAQIGKIAIENPIGAMSALYRKPDQIIQPWQFGHGETKATCLWLKGLPLLVPSDVVTGREPKCHNEPPSASRWMKRSVTYPGIAQAMADQWG